jgi:hypothetical protein
VSSPTNSSRTISCRPKSKRSSRAPKTPFQFGPKDPGTETVVAICNATGKADGIKHHFKKRGFTELGKYRDFLTRQIVVEGAEKIAEGRTGEREKENIPGVVQGAPASDILSRTAIKLVVK